MKTKYLVFAALGVAAVLLLRSEKGAAFREDFAENAGKWKDKLDKLMDDSSDKLADLRKTVGKEIAGLTDDTRKRILSILDEGTKTAKEVKGKASKQLS